mgnify:CR=1 FL=1
MDLLRYRYPILHGALSKLGDVKRALMLYVESTPPKQRPHFPLHYKSVREMQVEFLEGALCHELRARIEYSAVLGKTMGFSHVYPLLHPALVDFALRLPTEYKQRHGQNRYLVRKYLAQWVPEKNYTQKKRDGAHIMPAMMAKCAAHVRTGQLDGYKQHLPFAQHIQPASSFHSQVRHAIFAYMMHTYLR